MKKLTLLLSITILAALSINKVSAFTQKELNTYNQLKVQQDLYKQKLSTLKRAYRAHTVKKNQAKARGDIAAFKRYSAKIEDARYQKEDIYMALNYLQDELDSYDEIADSQLAKSNLIALN